MPKILHLADAHLGMYVSAFSEEKNSLRNREMEYTFIKALKKGADYDIVLMSGDIFDAPDCPTHLADAVLDAIQSCPDTRFFYSCGNHDPYISPIIDYCVRHCPTNLYIFGPECIESVLVEEKGVCVSGISFAGSHQSESLLSDLPLCDSSFVNILCVHGEIVGKGSAIYNPVSLSAIEKAGFDYAAFGHVHNFTGIKNCAGLTYAYCGSPEPHGFDECGPKGCICGRIDKDTVDLKFEKLSAREYTELSLDISAISDFSSLVLFINEHISSADNIYRITLVGQNMIGAFLDTRQLVSFCPAFSMTITDSTTVSARLEDYIDEPSLKGECVRAAFSLSKDLPPDAQQLYKKACALLVELFDSKGGIL